MMSASLRKKIAILLVVVQVILAFVILAGASQTSVLFYLGLFVSLLVVFSFYVLYEVVLIKNETEELKINTESEIEQKVDSSVVFAGENDEVQRDILDSKFNELLKKEKQEEAILSVLAQYFNMVQGVVYKKSDDDYFQSAALYAWFRDDVPDAFKEGQTLPGQVALNKKYLYLNSIPENYVSIYSGLGSASPRYLLFVPVLQDSVCQMVVEAAFFKELNLSSIEVINKWISEISLDRKSVNSSAL